MYLSLKTHPFHLPQAVEVSVFILQTLSTQFTNPVSLKTVIILHDQTVLQKLISHIDMNKMTHILFFKEVRTLKSLKTKPLLKKGERREGPPTSHLETRGEHSPQYTNPCVVSSPPPFPGPPTPHYPQRLGVTSRLDARTETPLAPRPDLPEQVYRSTRTETVGPMDPRPTWTVHSRVSRTALTRRV